MQPENERGLGDDDDIVDREVVKHDTADLHHMEPLHVVEHGYKLFM